MNFELLNLREIEHLGDLGVDGYGYGLGRAGSGYGQVAVSCECGNEPSGSIKFGESLE